MFEVKESKAEKTGKTIGFGIAMLLFASVFYYILSHFISILNLRNYLIVVAVLIIIYALSVIFRK